MRQTTIISVAAFLTSMLPGPAVRAQAESSYTISGETIAAIEKAAPDAPLVKPSRPRRILVYGREETHPESVVCCFQAMKILGQSTGAFEVQNSGDPGVFLPESLQQFDAVVMNNTHEQFPLRPRNFDRLGAAEQAEARAMEPKLKQSLLQFVAAGKGIVGIHGATAGSVQWPDFVRLFGAQYMSHMTGTVWVKSEDPDDPLCSFLKGQSFEVHDEIYMFRQALSRTPLQRDGLHVLLTLDMARTKDPGTARTETT